MALQPLVTAWGGISQVLCDREKPSGSRTPSSRSWGGENPVRVNTKLIHTPVSAGAEGAGAAQPAGVGSAPLGVGSFSLLGIFRDIKATGSSFSAFFFCLSRTYLALLSPLESVGVFVISHLRSVLFLKTPLLQVG